MAAFSIASFLLVSVGTLLIIRKSEAPTSQEAGRDEEQKEAISILPQVQPSPPPNALRGEPLNQPPTLPSEAAEPQKDEGQRNAARSPLQVQPSSRPSAPVQPPAAPATRPGRVDQTDESTRVTIRQRAEWKNRIDQAVFADKDIRLRSLSRSEARRLDDSGKIIETITLYPCADAQFVTHRSWDIWKKTQYPVVPSDSFVILSSSSGYVLGKRSDFAPYDELRSRPPVTCFSDGSVQFENPRIE
jgi:hypothetical protein